MLNRSIIKDQFVKSALQGQSVLIPARSRRRKILVFSLTLTSLIDAFSILVIYLLINFGAGQSVQPGRGMQLPLASQGVILNNGTVVSVNKGHYFIDGREVASADLARRLYEKRYKSNKPSTEVASLIIQADKQVSYDGLSPIILAGAQAEFCSI